MVAQPSFALVNLVASFLATLFYGMYCIIFATSMYFLLVNALGPAKHLPLFKSVGFISGCALWLSITTHWIITVVAVFQGFIYFGDGQDTNVYFNDNGRLTETLGDVFLSLSLLIGDAMIPSSHTKSGGSPASASPLAAQIFGHHFLAIVVESAALYTSWIISYMVCHQVNSNLQVIALSTGPSVVGIANALIHVRVALGKTIEQIFPVTAPIRFASAPSRSVVGEETEAVAKISHI
ncbi:hypothetical protein GGX14DRAFT_555585 [Mycena pura]|uniref:Uncharacterized protein n=1 Tax=Mycena pura TaxID=153505 RepID=A0AAD6YR67_9AGAR|nr:hypothetical protein GGX14DRAFT_555585 [Mycena pura]